jgi:hypothetical protein
MPALPLRFLTASAMGLVFITVGAALHGPAAWSSARLLRTGRRVTATVVEITPGGLTDPALFPGAVGFRRAIPPMVRLAFTLDGRRREKTLRLAGTGAETAYTPGQPVEIYVAGRLRTRIRSAAEPNERGPTDRVLGMCLMFAGFVSLIYFAVALAG